jgi:hypothetical protein
MSPISKDTGLFSHMAFAMVTEAFKSYLLGMGQGDVLSCDLTQAPTPEDRDSNPLYWFRIRLRYRKCIASYHVSVIKYALFVFGEANADDMLALGLKPYGTNYPGKYECSDSLEFYKNNATLKGLELSCEWHIMGSKDPNKP